MQVIQRQIPYVNIGVQTSLYKAEVMAEIEKVLESGMYILGERVARFEADFAALCGTKYAVGVNNGTDALFLVMRGLGIGAGHEVIVPPNSFLASASSIALIGATPVFADVRDDYNLDPDKLEKAITPRTRAIAPVHLTGRPADMEPILAIAAKHGLYVIEDCAQAVGAIYKGNAVGSMGIAGGFSLHPLKNLNAVGDGGMITTNDDKLYEYLLKARNHGLKNRDECEFWSYNSRLDAIQAAILQVKLKYLSRWNNRRREIAEKYQQRLGQYVWVPTDAPGIKSVYHTFIIQTERRNELMNFLKENGVDSKVHYPISIHLQEAAGYLGYKRGDFPVAERQMDTILSLPVFPELLDEEVDYICDTIERFFHT
ncbi:MAG: DegT/DnrJ/EryC1/StrS family aminotransferase [Bacteroidia bacterium]|nr:DegT/DnrJ/EryC1/StrS family aminotransferase [Bacteroidia bacterium]